MKLSTLFAKIKHVDPHYFHTLKLPKVTHTYRFDYKHKNSVSQMCWHYSLSSDCSVVVFLTSPLLASLLAIKKATIVINSPEIIIEFQAETYSKVFQLSIFKNWSTVSKEVQISSSYVLYFISLNDQLIILAVLKTISSLVKK